LKDTNVIVVNVMIESNATDIARVKDAISAMELASQAEAGCEDYTFSVELNNPDRLRITERWVSMDALAAHFKSPHMATFQAAMGTLTVTNREMNFYEATVTAAPGS